MEQTKVYNRFPMWIVVLSNFVGVSIYLIGAYILAGFGLWMAGLYLLYCQLLKKLDVFVGNCLFYPRRNDVDVFPYNLHGILPD